MKVRRPYEDLIAGLRALDVTQHAARFPTGANPSYFDGLSAVYYQSRDLGNAPLNWGPPNGYPDTALDWQSANGVLGRWNNHRSHADGLVAEPGGQGSHLARPRRAGTPTTSASLAPAAGDAAGDVRRASSTRCRAGCSSRPCVPSTRPPSSPSSARARTAR